MDKLKTKKEMLINKKDYLLSSIQHRNGNFHGRLKFNLN